MAYTYKKLQALIICCLICLSFHAHAQWNVVGYAGFSAAPVTYNTMALHGDTPYVAYSDADYGQKATVMKFNGTDWVPVGTHGFSPDTVGYVSVAISSKGTPYAAFNCRVTGDTNRVYKATVMKYNGSSWEFVGTPGFSTGTVWSIPLALDSNDMPYVAYVDVANGNKATVMRYNGTDWEPVGTHGVSAGSSGNIQMALSKTGTPFVCYSNGALNNKATVMKYDGSNWVTVGTAGISDSTVFSLSMALDGNMPYIAYDDFANTEKATVKKYDGSSWVTLGGAPVTSDEAYYPSMTVNAGGVPFISYSDHAQNYKMSVMTYNGASWVPLGNPGFSDTFSKYSSIAFSQSGEPYVVFTNFTTEYRTTVMRFGWATGINGPNITADDLVIFPNPTHGTFTLSLTSAYEENVAVTVTNVLGDVIKQQQTTTNTDSYLQLNSPPGLYFVTTITANGKHTASLVLQ